jgi:hypothetical protein
MDLMAKAKPCGYTLLLALSSISILPEADKVMNRAPLYQLDLFTSIARGSRAHDDFDPAGVRGVAGDRAHQRQERDAFWHESTERGSAISWGSASGPGDTSSRRSVATRQWLGSRPQLQTGGRLAL